MGRVLIPDGVQSADPSGAQQQSDAEWVAEIAILAEIFMANTIETLCTIEVLTPEPRRNDCHRRNMNDIKKKNELLQAIIVEYSEKSKEGV